MWQHLKQHKSSQNRLEQHDHRLLWIFYQSLQTHLSHKDLKWQKITKWGWQSCCIRFPTGAFIGSTVLLWSVFRVGNRRKTRFFWILKWDKSKQLLITARTAAFLQILTRRVQVWNLKLMWSFVKTTEVLQYTKHFGLPIFLPSDNPQSPTRAVG